MAAGNQIELGNLILVVVVVVCSYGLALILAVNEFVNSLIFWTITELKLMQVTCWTAYQRHRAPDIYCVSCCSPPPPAVSLQSGLPQYSSGPPRCLESHTADHRLGLLADGAVGGAEPPPSFSANLLSSNHPTFDFGPGCNVIEDVLDRDTTLSRSFRSTFPSQSSPLNVDINGPVTNSGDDHKMKLTLDQRFSALAVDAGLAPGDSASVQAKMSQVRVLTSPPATDHLLVASSASRTPNTARERSSVSKWSRKSLKSMLRKDKSPTEAAPETTETNLDTSATEDNEDVFLTNGNTKHAVTSNSKVKAVSRPGGDGGLRKKGSNGTSDWTDPKKQRKVGSPGRIGNADFFIRQGPLRSVDIDLGHATAATDDRLRSENIPRAKMMDRRSVSSAPHNYPTARSNFGGAKPKDKNTFLRPPSLRKKSRTRAYRPGYSESEDVTDFTSDEEQRRHGGGAARLLVPGAGRGPSPGSSAGDVSVTPPPPASTDASPADPSPLAPYTSASFTQSDMELVASPTAKSTDVPSTDAASLQWDDYDHQAELSFNLQ